MLRKTLRRLLALDDPPERTALAFATGVFIAFSPFLGLHTIMATAIAVWFRFNKIAIYAGIIINNPPFTMVPIIIASYGLGALLMGRPLSLPPEGMELLRHPHIFSGAYWRQVFGHSGDILLPYAIGGMALSVVCSAAAYPLTLKFLRRRKAKPTEDSTPDDTPVSGSNDG